MRFIPVGIGMCNSFRYHSFPVIKCTSLASEQKEKRYDFHKHYPGFLRKESPVREESESQRPDHRQFSRE